MFSPQGRNALVVGIADDDSIAWGCARAFRQQGCRLAVTWPSDKAGRHVRPLTGEPGAETMLPLDVTAVAVLLAAHEARNPTGGIHDIDGGFPITA